jgi:hypothetical protein
MCTAAKLLAAVALLLPPFAAGAGETPSNTERACAQAKSDYERYELGCRID